MAFDGFPKETIAFLARLSKNNDKKWFDAHRADYEAFYLEPAKELARALAPKMKKLDPKVHVDESSLMRIYRDVRFSKDKRPYKDHLDMLFWTGKKKGFEGSSFYLRVTPKEIMLGAGALELSPKLLAKYRKAVVSDAKGEKLAQIVKELRAAGYEVGAETYKRLPKIKGADEDHPRAALLKHKGLYAMWTSKHPKQLFTKKAIDYLLDHYRATAPIHTWLSAL